MAEKVKFIKLNSPERGSQKTVATNLRWVESKALSALRDYVKRVCVWIWP